ncbi:hypothetical protein Hanom_Chr11g00976281 [Helianthus anomalus]
MSLLSFSAAVTSPDSGVHASGSSLIFAGISNFSNRPVFAACKWCFFFVGSNVTSRQLYVHI